MSRRSHSYGDGGGGKTARRKNSNYFSGQFVHLSVWH
jgi:hypothetical protein